MENYVLVRWAEWNAHRLERAIERKQIDGDFVGPTRAAHAADIGWGRFDRGQDRQD